MNNEQAHRALLRREEDVAWMHLVQQFHRERGDVLRLLQRRNEQVRKAHETEVREAEAAFVISLSQRRRQIEDEETQKRAEERDAEARQKRLADEKKAARKAKAERKQERRETHRGESEKRRQAQIDRDAERERQRLATTAELHRLGKSEYNREHSRTPHPKSESVLAPPLRKAATPNFSPRRTIPLQQELDEAEAHAKAEQRQILEVRRLQNLLAQRQREEIARIEAEAERERLLEQKRIQAQKAEEERYHAQKRHVEIVLGLQREKERRLTNRLLVPVNRAADDTAGSAERYRTVSPRTAAGSEANKSDHQFDSEAVERRKASEARAREELKRHQQLLSLKNVANIEAQRKAKEEERKRLAEEYQRELQAAADARRAEEEQARLVVEIVKEDQRQQEQRLAMKRAERQKNAAINAVQTKLASVMLADQVAERDLQQFRDRMAEADLLTQNRKKARQLGKLNALMEHQKQEAIIAHNLAVRQQAQAEAERQRKALIQEHEKAHKVLAQNFDKFRDRQKSVQLEALASNEAFYSHEMSAKPKKPRVPVQPEASNPVVLPPHPEMAQMEREAAARMMAMEDDLATVDVKMRSLALQRI